MTLTTHIRIADPTPVRELFDFVTDLVGGNHPRFNGERPEFLHKEAWSFPENRQYANRPQGLQALVWLQYGPDGPLKEYEDDEAGYSEYPFYNDCAMELALDTPYGYENERGGGCNDLHAYLITQIAPFLNERKLRWAWQDEYTGEWFQGLDDLAKIGNPEIGEFHI